MPALEEPPYGWRADPDGTGFIRIPEDQLPPMPRKGIWCKITGLSTNTDMNDCIVEVTAPTLSEEGYGARILPSDAASAARHAAGVLSPALCRARALPLTTHLFCSLAQPQSSTTTQMNSRSAPRTSRHSPIPRKGSTATRARIRQHDCVQKVQLAGSS